MESTRKEKFEELKERSSVARENPRLKRIAEISYSAQAAYDLAILDDFGESEARSCQDLARIRIHFSDEFLKLVGPIEKSLQNGRRHPEELRIRSKKALANPRLTRIATESKSPSEAFTRAMKEGFSEEEALSCRMLAQMKKYYYKEFKETINGSAFLGIGGPDGIIVKQIQTINDKSTQVTQKTELREATSKPKSKKKDLSNILFLTKCQWESLQEFIKLPAEGLIKALEGWNFSKRTLKRLIKIRDVWLRGLIMVEGFERPPELEKSYYGVRYLNQFRGQQIIDELKLLPRDDMIGVMEVARKRKAMLMI